MLSKEIRKNIYFVSGIDTDIGKSYATGMLMSLWRERGVDVVTQKFIQTGCGDDVDAVSADIVVHRRVAQSELLPEDIDHTTCPLRFSYPASPDLAARIQGRKIDLKLVDCATQRLLKRYDMVIIEGAGGVMVPIDGFYTTLDYVQERGLPLVLVTSARLGSVNHTLMTLEVCHTRGVEVAALVYNLHGATSQEITDDTREYFKRYIAERLPDCEFIEMPDYTTCDE